MNQWTSWIVGLLCVSTLSFAQQPTPTNAAPGATPVQAPAAATSTPVAPPAGTTAIAPTAISPTTVAPALPQGIIPEAILSTYNSMMRAMYSRESGYREFYRNQRIGHEIAVAQLVSCQNGMDFNTKVEQFQAVLGQMRAMENNIVRNAFRSATDERRDSYGEPILRGDAVHVQLTQTAAILVCKGGNRRADELVAQLGQALQQLSGLYRNGLDLMLLIAAAHLVP